MAIWEGASILVIRLSSMGDVVRLLPSLQALRGSGAARVDLTVEDRFAPLMDLFPVTDGVVVYPRKRPGSPWRHPMTWASAMATYRRELRVARYDLALDLHGILRSALVARMSGAKETAGYARGFGKEGSHHLYDRGVVPGPSPAISRYERYAGTLRAMGLPEPGREYLEPRVPGRAVTEVDAFLAGAGLTGCPYLFAFLGTSRAQARKRWPLARFMELARSVHERFGLPTLLGWGPEEAELIRTLGPEEGIVAIPDWDMPRLVEVIRRSSAFVGADTGAMHLAALMGVPTVAVLGPTDPVLNQPFGDLARVVFQDGIRRACKGLHCDHRDCMARIGAAQVLSALSEVLSGQKDHFHDPT
jgi:lipopolysaccharide heptosyltransferase I